MMDAAVMDHHHSQQCYCYSTVPSVSLLLSQADDYHYYYDDDDDDYCTYSVEGSRSAVQPSSCTMVMIV